MKAFHEVLGFYVARSRYSGNQLAELSGVPAQTIHSWLDGRVKRPRSWYQILKVAKALHLSLDEANHLLQSAKHKKIPALLAQTQTKDDPKSSELLANWEDEEPSEQRPLFTPPFQAPHQLKEFVGRQDTLKAVVQTCRQGGKICILQGMGGVGKTSLAIELAYELRLVFPDGVLWADLDHLPNEGDLDESAILSILQTFAAAYSRNVNAETTLVDRSRVVRELLANKRVLVVLNDAHSTAEIEPLLPPSTGHGSVIITTRNKRMLSDRAISFDIDPFDSEVSLHLLSKYLKRERIKSQKESANQIVELLGGLPLALKIVASDLAETPQMPLGDYLTLLADEYTRLEHLQDWENASQSVRASFAVSFRRLPKELQLLFASLGVFVGHDFSLEAITAVYATLSSILIRRQMGRLYSLSLVEHQSSGDDSTRYHLHPLLRLYAHEKMTELHDVPQLQKKRASYFIEHSSRHPKAYLLLDRDWENIQASLQWAYEQEKFELYLEGVEALTAVNLGVVGFLDARGYWQIAQTLLEQAVQVTDNTLTQAILTFKQGVFAFRLHQSEKAKTHFAGSLALFADLPHQPQMVLHRACLAEFMARLAMPHDTEEAMAHLEDGLSILDELDTPHAQHQRGNLYVVMSTLLGRYTLNGHDKAVEVAEKGLTLLPEEPTPSQLDAYTNLNVLLDIKGNVAESIHYARKGVRMAEELGDRSREARFRLNLGILYKKGADIKSAVQEQENALAIGRHIGDVRIMGSAHNNLTMLNIILGEDEKAITHAKEGIQLAETHSMGQVQAFISASLANLYLIIEKPQEAEPYITKSKELCREHRLSYLLPNVLSLEAEQYRLLGNYKQAVTLAERACRLAQDAGYLQEEGIAWSVWGRILDAIHQFDDALICHKNALENLKEQDLYELARARLFMAFHHYDKDEPAEGRMHLLRSYQQFEQLQAKREMKQINKQLSADI